MKTTVDIPDALLRQAKQHARKSGRPLRALVEEGLRLVVAEKPSRFELPDRSVGVAGGPNPLAGLTWDELRDAIYGEASGE